MKKDNRKQVKAYSLGGVILLIVIIALVVGGILSVPSLKNCDSGSTVSTVRNAEKSDGIFGGLDVSTTEESYYYLDIPLKDKILYVYDKEWLRQSVIGGEVFSRKDVEVSLLIEFPDVEVSGESIYTMASGVVINIPAYFSTGHKIIFTDNVFINLRETYYTVLKKQEDKLSTIRVSVIHDKGAIMLSTVDWFYHGQPMATKYTLDGVSVKQEEQLRPGDNGLGDNGGISSTNRSIWEMIVAWYNSRNGFIKFLIWFAIVFVGISVIAFIAMIVVKAIRR